MQLLLICFPNHAVQCENKVKYYEGTPEVFQFDTNLLFACDENHPQYTKYLQDVRFLAKRGHEPQLHKYLCHLSSSFLERPLLACSIVQSCHKTFLIFWCLPPCCATTKLLQGMVEPASNSRIFLYALENIQRIFF